MESQKNEINLIGASLKEKIEIINDCKRDIDCKSIKIEEFHNELKNINNTYKNSLESKDKSLTKFMNDLENANCCIKKHETD